jgi:nucleoside-diphosphate-sugar epimerase
MMVLVTGGTGFIGSHLVDRLVEANHNVLVPVRKESNIKWLPSHRVDVKEVDLLDLEAVKGLLKGIDVVFHLASIRGMGWSFEDEEVHRVNVGITENLLKVSLSKKVKHYIYVSSVSVYGHSNIGPIDENYPYSPVTRYGKTKYKSEMLVEGFYKDDKLPTTIIRPVITYGPRDTWGMIVKLIRLINSGKYLTVGSGENRVHLVYIDDLINGLISVVKNPIAIGKTYILAGEIPITINKLVGIIASLLNRNVPSLHIPIWLARLTGLTLEGFYRAISIRKEPFITRDKVDIMTRDRSFNIGKAIRELGYTPGIGYEEGLKKTVDWIRYERLI